MIEDLKRHHPASCGILPAVNLCGSAEWPIKYILELYLPPISTHNAIGNNKRHSAVDLSARFQLDIRIFLLLRKNKIRTREKLSKMEFDESSKYFLSLAVSLTLGDSLPLLLLPSYKFSKRFENVGQMSLLLGED
jgi:hypothetical protein